jgi:hypothetical protein
MHQHLAHGEVHDRPIQVSNVLVKLTSIITILRSTNTLRTRFCNIEEDLKAVFLEFYRHFVLAYAVYWRKMMT